MFGLLFLSLRIALAAVLPSILSVGVMLGTMGVLGIPLDIMTITIAAIGVGIGVDDSILKKPGRLTPEEHEHIKTHAFKTKTILNQVNFEGIYTEVPEIAGAHHEKLDGTGYPNGLKGDQIHFGAKIIACADVFEALTSKRHYRDPMPLDEAFNYLVENIGIHFERECVDALIDFYNKNFTDIPYVPKGKISN